MSYTKFMMEALFAFGSGIFDFIIPASTPLSFRHESSFVCHLFHFFSEVKLLLLLRTGNIWAEPAHRDRKSGQHHAPGQRQESWGNESFITGGNKQKICTLNIKFLFMAHPLFTFLFFWYLPESSRSPKVNITGLDVWVLSHSVKQTSVFTFLLWTISTCVACYYVSRKIKQN